VRYLGLALFSEGPTDDRFLALLLQRLCQDLCLKHSIDVIDVAEEMLPLENPKRDAAEPRAERVARAATEAAGAWHLLFVHADGAGDPAAQQAHLIDPALARVEARCGTTGVGVAVVPVRETEAWALADGDALRFVFGTTLDDAALGLPGHARLVEAIADPKRALNEVYARTNPGGRRARAGAAALLPSLGQQASLVRLRQVPSFARTEDRVMAALQRLRIVAAADT
jgi:hypothetical protein